MVELEMLEPEGGAVIHRLGPKPLYIGRAPTNDIVLTDATISSRHAVLWVASGQIWLEDLNSRNGTHVDGIQVTGLSALPAGTRIRFGSGSVFQIRGEPVKVVAETVPVLEDARTGIQYPFHTDRFLIGPREVSDLVVPGPEEIMVLIESSGAVSLGRDDDTLAALPVGEIFQVGSRHFRIALRDALTAQTREVLPTAYPYLVRATLDGGTGPLATVTDTDSQRRVEIVAANRAILLYVLAQQLRADREGSKMPDQCGWCFDEELVTRIWGRASVESHRNNLAVLICRTRGDVRKGGLDPWFIEKHNRHIRIRAAEIVIG